MHLEELQNIDKRMEKNATLLWKKHTDNFSDWIKKKVSLILIYPSIDKKDFFLLQNLCKMICLQIPIQSTSDEILKWIDFCPSSNALSYKGYIINDIVFIQKTLKEKPKTTELLMMQLPCVGQVQKIFLKELMWSFIIG